MAKFELFVDDELKWSQQIAGFVDLHPEIGAITTDGWARRLLRSAIKEGAISEADLPKVKYRIR